MGTNGLVKALYVAVAAAVLFFVYGALKPTSTRDETSATPAPAPEASTGPSIPEDVLQVPPPIQAMSGIRPDPDHGVWYMPYAVTNEEQGIAMVHALRAEILRGNGFPDRLQVPEGQGAGGRDLLYPTEPGVSRFYISDINDPAETAVSESRIPLIITQPHEGEYAVDVLFLDGHMASVPVGQFPLSNRFITALSLLDTPEHEEKTGKKRP